MNSIDTSGKIKFTMSVAINNSILEFLDFSLHINEHNKICVDVYAKPGKKSINKVPKRIALRLANMQNMRFR